MFKSSAYAIPGVIIGILWVLFLPIDTILAKAGHLDCTYAGLCANIAGHGSMGAMLWLAPGVLGGCLCVVAFWKSCWEMEVKQAVRELTES